MQHHQHHTPHPLIRLREHLLDVLYILAFVGYSITKRTLRKTRVGVRALVVRDDDVLLIRHRLIFFPWCLPGGSVGKHERLDEAVRREVQEEAGCTVRVERLQGVFRNTRRGANIYTLVFVCTPLSDISPPVADLEIVDARYVPLDALPARIESGSYARIMEYRNSEHSVSSEWVATDAEEHRH